MPNLNFTIEVKGLDKFTEGLKKFPEFTIAEMNKAVARSIGLLQNQTIKEAPVNKQAMGGNLRQSVRSRMNTKISGEVEVEASYGIFVHEGTAPHLIRPVHAKALANVRTGQFFGKLVHHPGTKPNPFLKRAIEAVTPRVKILFQEAIQNVLNKVAAMV